MSGDGGDTKAKKKKKKPKVGVPGKPGGIRIIDDDADAKFEEDIVEEKFDLNEELPTVAGLVDERPEVVRKMEMFSTSDKWKRLDATQESAAKSSRRRHDSDDSDASPSRDGDQSPPRAKKRHDSDSDASPPRNAKRKRHDSDSDASPPRRRHDSDSDLSPPRPTKQTDGDKARGSDSDNSPPRRKPVKGGRDSDNSPPRRNTKGDDSDNSPPRRRKDDDDDNSPPRRPRPDGDDRKATHTSRGLKAGLQSAKDMRKENEAARRKEDKAFSQLDAKQSGRDAATVFREKGGGKKRDLEAERKEKEEKDKKEAERKAKYDKWGKGMIQNQQQRQNIEDALHEVSKPLARMKDDEDLDAMLKERVREDDPMLAFITKKKKAAKKGPELPTYKGSFPINRFNIRPGYRWDGVDRSNGFEKDYYTKQADWKSHTDAAYKWSTEDM